MEFSKKLKLFLDEKKLLRKYIQILELIVGKTVVGFEMTMDHLIVMKGLDPCDPQKQLMKKIEKEICVLHTKSYDRDFDFSLFEKGFRNLSGLDISKKAFRALTDLSNIKDDVIVNKKIPEKNKVKKVIKKKISSK